MKNNAELYAPSVMRFPKDLATRYDLLRPARERGFTTGLMLVLRPNDLASDVYKRQMDNLDPFVKLNNEERPRVFAMHPNMPVDGDEPFNLLTNPSFSREFIEKGIDLVMHLPSELTPKTGRLLTFHLNTLIKPAQWKNDEEYWARAFEGVLAHVRDIADYAKRNHVGIAIETTPITEFGDSENIFRKFNDDPHTLWSDLGNPWPLLFWRDEIRKIRSAGSNVAIDVCHSYIALRTVQEVARLADEGKDELARNEYMVHKSDQMQVANTKPFDQAVLDATVHGDVWHVNDAKGIHKRPRLHGERTPYEEGISLFEGDIPVEVLRKLIQKGVKHDIKFVIEVNETDFQKSPNTKKSLEIVLAEATATNDKNSSLE